MVHPTGRAERYVPVVLEVMDFYIMLLVIRYGCGYAELYRVFSDSPTNTKLEQRGIGFLSVSFVLNLNGSFYT